MHRAFAWIALVSLSLTACSVIRTGNSRPTIYQWGDRATVGKLVYSVTDAQTAAQLGPEATAARIPRNRFYLIRVNVSNSGTSAQEVPAMSLLDDAGDSFNELTDGSGLEGWLGVVRKAGPGQTVSGYVLFDAPTKHYRLRINDPLEEKEIAIDLPDRFVHEQLLYPAESVSGADLPGVAGALPDALDVSRKP